MQENHETFNGDPENHLHQTTVERSGASIPYIATARTAVLRPDDLLGKTSHEVEYGHVAPSTIESNDQPHRDKRQKQAYGIATQRKTITSGSGKSEVNSQDKRERANLIEMVRYIKGEVKS